MCILCQYIDRKLAVLVSAKWGQKGSIFRSNITTNTTMYIDRKWVFARKPQNLITWHACMDFPREKKKTVNKFSVRSAESNFENK